MGVDRRKANGRKDERASSFQISWTFLELVIVLLCLCIVVCCCVAMLLSYNSFVLLSWKELFNEVHVFRMQAQLVVVVGLALALRFGFCERLRCV